MAVVVLCRETDEETLKKELLKHLNQFVEQGNILTGWIPEKYVSVAESPKTSVGKFNKKELRLRFGETLQED